MTERSARDAAVFVPRRWIIDEDVDVDGFMGEVNETVKARGIILADGQVIKTPFSDSHGYVLYSDDSAFDTLAHRAWGPAQRGFFGLENPNRLPGCTISCRGTTAAAEAHAPALPDLHAGQARRG